MSYVLGIDIGTYQSKGVLVRKDGQVVVNKSTDHQLEIPRQGYAEHDADQTWWRDFKLLSNKIVNEATVRYNIKSEQIKGVGVSAIAPAVVPIDQSGKPLRKAILYGVDTRASGEIEELNRIIGAANIFKDCGQELSSQSTGPKILWIKNNEPQIFEKTSKFLAGNGYIIFKLTGEYVLDFYTATAYAPMLNINKQRWHDQFIKVITNKEKLPPLTWSHQVVGQISKKAAEETGLQAGTAVIAGTADALAESISIGAVQEGDLMLMYGSSTFFIQVVRERPVSRKLWPSLHAVPGKNTLTGGTATAGSITRWFLENWLDSRTGHPGLHQGYTYLTKKAEKSSIGANGLITLPYFSGERTPLHDPEARGVFFGLTLKHNLGDIYRSILEGVGFSLRHNIDEMAKQSQVPARVIAVGGGSKSRFWLQAVSDICRLKQLVPKVNIGASYGDAFLTALGLGWYDSLEEVNNWVNYSVTINPDEACGRKYDRYYSIYRRLYDKTRLDMKEISLIRGGQKNNE